MSNATPIKLFPVDSYDLKSMSFKFGNDIFIIFEMPESSYQRPVGKNNISLLFRPSVIRGPWIIKLQKCISLYLPCTCFLIPSIWLDKHHTYFSQGSRSNLQQQGWIRIQREAQGLALAPVQ